MNKVLAVTVISMAVFFLSQQAVAEQVLLTPVKDATLYEDDAGALANGSGNYLFFGKVGSTGDNKLRRSLIQFDVSSIPAEAVIDQVSLTLEINMVPMNPVGGLASLHRLTSSWGEGPSIALGAEGQGTLSLAGDATWLHRVYPGSLWSTPGGDYQLTPSAEEPYDPVDPPLVITSTPGLRQDVKSWVNNPASNHGWILRGAESEFSSLSARRVYARESTDPAVPLLTVDYSIPSPTDNLELTEIATGLTRPVVIANANDSSGRLFIVEQAGRIRIFDTATQALLASPYLDISSIVDDTGNEQGLLGLAFHPDFINNRQFYVYYTRDPGDGPPDPPDRSVVAMYQQDLATPNVAQFDAKSVLLEFEQEAANHNGGDMHFDRDGYLNIASGDGGGSGDQHRNAQNINSLKGKILRIDVNGTPPGGGELCGLVRNYGIPQGNAFPGSADGCDEILHLGLRNPWKFSFDAQTEEMYIGDVGQVSWEEVNLAPAGAAGLNFGWPCREGFAAHPPPSGVTCPAPLQDPIIAYARLGGGNNCAVTGGYVYRGSAASIAGYYVYGDYCTGRIWLAKNLNGSWASTEWSAAAPALTRLSAFGQDQQCELYLADMVSLDEPGFGKIYRIDDSEMVQRSGFEALRCQ